jgi:hypothetical protein
MENQTKTNVVLSFSKNKDNTNFSGMIDCSAVISAVAGDRDATLAAVRSMFETEVNRTSGGTWRLLAGDNPQDATEWLIERLTGKNAGTGRYKISDADKKKGKELFTKHEMLGDGDKWIAHTGLPFTLESCEIIAHEFRVKMAELAKAGPQ